MAGQLASLKQRSRKLPNWLGITLNKQLSLLPAVTQQLAHTFPSSRRKPDRCRVSVARVTAVPVERTTKKVFVRARPGERSNDYHPRVNRTPITRRPTTFATQSTAYGNVFNFDIRRAIIR